MPKIISQETFDDVVKENIVDFSMSTKEAKDETIKQFAAQGISLTNIIKDLSINDETGKPILNEAIEDLKAHIGRKSIDTGKLIEYLTVLDTECQKSLAHRILASKNGAYDVLITLFDQELLQAASNKHNLQVLCKCLIALNSLTNKQPDLFDAQAMALILKALKLQDETLTCLTLQWLQKACIMHEQNRQNIMASGIIKQLKPLVCKQSSIQIITDVAALLRYLVLDDDIRVEFGSAHEHARQIAGELIVDLTKLLNDMPDSSVLADLLLTIGTLAVRQEFCTTIEDAGGLKSLFEIMLTNKTDARLNREALKLIRALAGNDAVKVNMVQQGVAAIIKEVLEAHIANENVVAAALACVSTITLRVKDNSTAFFETGIVDVIVECMRMHSKNKVIQRNGAWSVRNMVSRSREQCETWLSLGVEELLNNAMSAHPTVQQDIKAALRDLGCKVSLKEEWTGTAEKKILNTN